MHKFWDLAPALYLSGPTHSSPLCGDFVSKVLLWTHIKSLCNCKNCLMIPLLFGLNSFSMWGLPPFKQQYYSRWKKKTTALGSLIKYTISRNRSLDVSLLASCILLTSRWFYLSLVYKASPSNSFPDCRMNKVVGSIFWSSMLQNTMYHFGDKWHQIKTHNMTWEEQNGAQK